MTGSTKHKIFIETECISAQAMFDYIDKKLTDRESHSVEKHLLHCELCSDALEGLELTKNRNRVNTINQKISEQIAAPQKENKVTGFNYKLIFSIAASVLLLIGGIFFFNQFNKNDTIDTIAEFKTEPEHSPAPPPPSEFESSPAPDETISDSENLNMSEKLSQEPDIGSKTTFDNETTDESKQLAFAEKKAAERDSKTGITTGAGAAGTNVATPKNQVLRMEETEKETPTSLDNSIYDAPLTKNEEQQKSDHSYIIPKREKAGSYANNQSLKLSAPSVSDELTTKSQDDERNSSYAISEETKKTKKLNNRAKISRRKEAEEEHKDKDIAENIAYAPQQMIADEEEDEPLATATTSVSSEQPPEFPGGQDSLLSFIHKNFGLPINNKKQQEENRTIFVRFTIDEKGNVKYPEIIKGISPESDKEALRVINMMPKWKPGSFNGKPISKKVDLPIKLE